MSDNAQSTARGIEFITLADLQNVKDHVIPFGPIGEIVDIRTYRRWLPDVKRRETALERWQRVINYNLNLVADIRPYDELRTEALLMLDKYVALQADVSGRTKWVGGTDAADRNPASQFNCSGLAVNRLEAFADAFNLLMLGVGVGFRVHQKDVNQLPGIFWSGVLIKFKDYTPVPAAYRQENTAVSSIGDSVVDIGVGDSRQGWVDALMHYLEIVTRSGKWADVDLPDHIIFNFDSVRPQGERLNGFGGTASGYQALQGIITDVQRVIQECPTDRLRSIDCMDIMCAIAKGVVAGSSRRSAMICLFEDGDQLCASAKVGLYTNPDMAHKSYRCQSNNTCQLAEKPSIEQLRQLLDTCRTEGEPGFNNYSTMVSRRRAAAKLWRPDQPFDNYTDVVTNPCHEIILSAGLDGKSGSFCNLTTLPLPNFIITLQSAMIINFPALESAIRLNVRTSLRQTCVDIGMDGWAETQLDERLLGVSITGAQDAFALLGWETESLEVEEFLKYCRYVANEEATEYATKLGVPRPLLVTTIKPEGTGSQVFGCSNGLHWDWSPYYIRRVRMTANDALAQTLMDQGFPCYPEIYDLSKEFPDITDPWEQIKAFDQRTTVEKRDILSACNTVVFEFPVKSYSDRTQADVGAIEQLENVKTFTVSYCDHMPSSTITVKDGEWDAVAEWIHENWDSYITASFFPYSDAKYPLLPYEAITEQQYNTLSHNIPKHSKRVLENGRITYTVDEDRLNWYERKLEDPDDVDLASSGSCPIR